MFYDKSGTEHLRSQRVTHGPSAHDTPNTSGADVGGTKALGSQTVVYEGGRRTTPKGGSSNLPTAYQDARV